ncbi:hypothetical protein [Oceanobacillus rekensis]|uniref:hypothetical protein n=1 Tax=Oceanobacillus rekensis TaxID=937927 RepID=UPI000B4331C2|nr:hypothetical protein [Oceanobacillus rekensis]
MEATVQQQKQQVEQVGKQVRKQLEQQVEQQVKLTFRQMVLRTIKQHKKRTSTDTTVGLIITSILCIIALV